jgi:ubiquinone/menaquinone biosynthesis C-methylase UbiE
MMHMNEQEIARIQQVYQGYSDAGLGATRWSAHNAGNRQIAGERRTMVGALLQKHGYAPLAGRRVLDVGCGGGDVLAEFQAWGGQTQNLYGVELLAQRAQAAHARHPELQIAQANAAQLSYGDATFDLVVFFTVFSSVLREELRQEMAAETMRVLRPRGAVVWYDLRTPNPRNPNIRPLRAAQIAELFPGLTPHLQTATVLPPLARRLGKSTAIMYPRLGVFPWLHTHHIGLLIDERH